MKTTDDADRETEAAIRKRIAEEVRRKQQEFMDDESEGDYSDGMYYGLLLALRIIERGTGVEGEEQG